MLSKLIPTKVLIILTLLGLSSCFAGNKSDEIQEDKSILAQDLKVNEHGLSDATAQIRTVHGNIVFKFYPKEAPHTVSRIITLIEDGFYNGLTFHRVVPNFVIQGGDPQGTGTGGSGQNLRAEFSELQHVRGTVAMARAQDIHSADSQFYIALNTLPHLDGQYTIFGQVIEGLDILDKVSVGDKIIEMTFHLNN